MVSDLEWDQQRDPPTQPPFLHWGDMIEMVKEFFEYYQNEGDYKEMDVNVWSGEEELAQGGVFLFPSPAAPELEQA